MTGSLRSCATCNVYYDKNLAIRKVTDADGKPVDAAKLVFRRGPAWKLDESAGGEEGLEVLRRRSGRAASPTATTWRWW